MSGRDDVSNEYLLHSLAQGEVSPEVAAATSLTVEVRQLRAERTTPAPSSGAGLDLDASHVRTDPACTFHDGTTPPASRGKRCPACMRLDLDAMARRYSTATDDEVIYEMYPALEAEVRRLAALCIPLTDLAQELDLSRQNLHHSRAMSSAHFERAEREKARAESAEAEVRRLTAVDDDLSRQIHETGGLLERAQAAVDAEAEVVTLRARLAAVEAHPVVLELAEERTRQTAKHGDQSHLPDGTGAVLWLSMDDDYIRRHGIRRDNLAAWAKARTDEASQARGDGSITFEHILTEEWAEAIAESDPDALRAELVQVAAVAVQWVEAIDLRAALATTGEGQHVAREVFTADGIPFVSCLCTNAKSPTRWLTDWLIRYDPDDGEPYGEICDCEIGDDHDATGEGE